MRSAPQRHLAQHIDRFGNVAVRVQVGNGHTDARQHQTGISAPPSQVAAFLRELADGIEHAGQGHPEPAQ